MELKVERDAAIAIVTYSHPPVNALAAGTLPAIRDAFTALGEDRSVRAIVFTAEGERAFMAGADLKARNVHVPTDDEQRPASEVVDMGRKARDAFWAVYECGVPVVTAVNGPALGAGMAFVAVSDFVVAAEHARFGMTEINVGILGGGAFMERMLGPVRARKMFLSGRQAPAQEFFELGIVDAVVPSVKLMDTAMDLARGLAAKSPIAMRLAKESMLRIETLPLKEAYRIEQDYTHRLVQFDDATEARRAFVEKREPTWRWQ
jgi:enoyl-CoA hydratase